MISAWWLLLCVPSVALGFLLGACLRVGAESDDAAAAFEAAFCWRDEDFVK